MMTKTWLGLHKEAELLLFLVVLAMLGWGCGASKQPAQGVPSGGASSGETAAESGSKKTSLYEHSENAIIEGKAHPANEQNDDKPGLKGVRFPFGELQDYGLPEHLAESGRKVTSGIGMRDADATMADYEAYWRGWANMLVKPESDDKALREHVHRYGEEAVLKAVKRPSNHVELGEVCAFAEPKTADCLSIKTVAATLIEACRVDAVFQHTLRALPLDSEATAPRRPPELKASAPFKWARGWFSYNARSFRVAPWTEKERGANVPWLADREGRLLDDQTILQLCSREATDNGASNRIVGWMSKPAMESIHPAHAKVKEVFGKDILKSKLDWLRAREWMILINGIGASNYQLVIVDIAHQFLRVVEVGAKESGVPLQELPKKEYRVVVGNDDKKSPTPIMLSQFAPRDSYQAYPRWTRTRKGKQYKEDFSCGTGRSRQCLLHGEKNPLGDFKIMPTSIGGLSYDMGWASEPNTSKGKLVRIEGYYIHGTNRKDLFRPDNDGSRTLSNGCVRAPREFLNEIVHKYWTTTQPTCNYAKPSKDYHCWLHELGSENCNKKIGDKVDTRVRDHVCWGLVPTGSMPSCSIYPDHEKCKQQSQPLKDQGECLREVPLDKIDKRVNLYVLFGYFSGGSDSKTSQDPYNLDARLKEHLNKFSDRAGAPKMVFNLLETVEEAHPEEGPDFPDLEQDERAEELEL